MKPLLIRAILVWVSSLILAACFQAPKSNSNSNANSNHPPPVTTVKITQPVNGDSVEHTEVVRGTSQKIPDEQKIWIVVFVQKAGRYYIQNNPADVQANGEWTSLTYFGIPKDVGLKFDILAVTADNDAQAAFSRYLNEARDRNDYPGLEQVPKGTTTHDRITVTRK
jgi:hypothetical protein